MTLVDEERFACRIYYRRGSWCCRSTMHCTWRRKICFAAEGAQSAEVGRDGRDFLLLGDERCEDFSSGWAAINEKFL